MLANTNNFEPLTASCKARAGSSPLGISYEITQKLLSLRIALFRAMLDEVSNSPEWKGCVQSEFCS